MTTNKQQSPIPQSEEVGVLLTKPRSYRALRSGLLLGRGAALSSRLIALSGVGQGDQIVDIGCGPGDLALAFAVHVGVKGAVTGIDPSSEMIDYATERARGLSQCRFELGTAQTLPIPDASVDVVTTTFAMHHIPEPQRHAAVAHMFRALRPGGRLLVADTYPSGRVLPFAIRIMAKYAARRTHDPIAVSTDPLAAVDVRRYRDLLLEAGFSTVEFTEIKPLTGVLLAVKPS